MKFDLYFSKNSLKNCCHGSSADKILHWLPLSSTNGLLFILRFRLPTWTSSGRKQGMNPKELVKPFPCSPCGGGLSKEEVSHVLMVGRSSPRRGPAGVKDLPRSRHSGQLGVKEESTIHLPQYKLDGCFRIWVLILSYLRANRCLAENCPYFKKVLKINLCVFLVLLF